jgi:hypothetical protein
MEAIFCSETSLDLHRTVGLHISEDTNFIATAVITSNPALQLSLVYRQGEQNVLWKGLLLDGPCVWGEERPNLVSAGVMKGGRGSA